jgi:hypothetical protein
MEMAMSANGGYVHDSRRPAGGRRAEALLWRSAIGCIITLALVLFLAPDPSHAQSVAKMPRIGILTPAFDPYPPP